MAEENQDDAFSIEGAPDELVVATPSSPEEDTDNYGGYVCFRTIGEGKLRTSVHITADRDNMLSWRERFGQEQSDRPEYVDVMPGSAEASVEAENKPETLHEFLVRAREGLTAFHPMIAASSVMMPAMRARYIHDKMYRSAISDLNPIDSGPSFDIFGIHQETYPSITRQVRRLRELDRGMELMPSAVLLSMVATFDYLLSDLVRILIARRPDRLENSSKTMTIKEILLIGSFDEVRQKVIDDEIDSLMRGSHSDQISYIESNFGIKIRSTYDRWSEFIEIFERRNLAAHGNLKVNSIYLSNCSEHGVDVAGLSKGQPLILDQRYLKNAADILLEFIMLCVLTLWKKTSPEESVYATDIFGSETYELIRDGRNCTAARLLDFVLNKQSNVVDESSRKILIINHAIALIKDGKKKEGFKVLDGTDWSASSDDYRICEAAIRENVDMVIKLMPIAVQGQKITLTDVREWPAFDWVRNDPRFRSTVKETFGEDLAIEDASDGPGISLKISKIVY